MRKCNQVTWQGVVLLFKIVVKFQRLVEILHDLCRNGKGDFVRETKGKLGIRELGRGVIGANGYYELGWPETPYEAILGPEARLSLDAFSQRDTVRVIVFSFHHLCNEVSLLQDFWFGISSGENEFNPLWLGIKKVQKIG